MIAQHPSTCRLGDLAGRFWFSRALAAAAAVLCSVCLADSATVIWTGSGDGVSWHQAANWSNNILPSASDDAVIGGVATTVTIMVASNVTVQSIQSSASLNVAGGNVSLTKGGSQIAGDFIVAAGRSLTVSGPETRFTALGSSTIDGAGLYAKNGAVLELPGIGQAAHTGNFDMIWRAEGAGSRLVFPALTNLAGFASGSWWRIQAYTGGRIELPALTAITNGWFQVYADGTGAAVDLSALTAFEPSRTDHYLLLEARNNGSVLLPQLTDGSNVVLVLRSGGTIPVGQLTRLQQATLDGVSVAFSSLATVDDTSLYLQNGAVLELPGIGQAAHTG
ncbi:MAG TPA: hypothetical protein P5022_07920, partial [Candidatus Paceibacterota bacterium]|nr:hypothetical protein [Candidatus Paceibacterota bacterium]